MITEKKSSVESLINCISGLILDGTNKALKIYFDNGHHLSIRRVGDVLKVSEDNGKIFTSVKMIKLGFLEENLRIRKMVIVNEKRQASLSGILKWLSKTFNLTENDIELEIDFTFNTNSYIEFYDSVFSYILNTRKDIEMFKMTISCGENTFINFEVYQEGIVRIYENYQNKKTIVFLNNWGTLESTFGEVRIESFYEVVREGDLTDKLHNLTSLNNRRGYDFKVVNVAQELGKGEIPNVELARYGVSGLH